MSIRCCGSEFASGQSEMSVISPQQLKLKVDSANDISALLLRPLDFDADAIARLLALGRADALECLAAWERK